MSNALYHVPKAVNEPVLTYLPNSPEKIAFKATLAAMKAQSIEIPMHIGGAEVTTTDRVRIHPPYDIATTIGYYHRGNAAHATAAIEAALKAKSAWENMPWQERAAIFLKAADLISTKYRARMNAATMLAQSKNIYQSEIDAIAEQVDFFRFNVEYMEQIYAQQPNSSPGVWNRLEHRPLEGFVYALTPFNFTAIAANLCVAPAMLGNVVVWKPADQQIYSAHVIMEILIEAGLPAGVINLIYGDGPELGDVIFKHPDFAGLHFTGSTKVFQTLWQTIGMNLPHYKTYPRIVGETGGKDFVIAHPSADPKAVAVGLLRGAFEFQGQKCSAASRAYLPESLYDTVKGLMLDGLKTMRMGSPEDFRNFVNAVIDERAFDKITGYLDYIKQSDDAEILAGGNTFKGVGYFIEPTLVVTKNPQFRTMVEEIFGPVLTIYVYPDAEFEHTLHLVDETSPYALTGAIFSRDRAALVTATEILKHAAGNLYYNDKPTGAVVGQQPFGGARASGTNDKAGSILNLYRWVSPRTIKEVFMPPTDYRYPFLGEE